MKRSDLSTILWVTIFAVTSGIFGNIAYSELIDPSSPASHFAMPTLLVNFVVFMGSAARIRAIAGWKVGSWGMFMIAALVAAFLAAAAGVLSNVVYVLVPLRSGTTVIEALGALCYFGIFAGCVLILRKLTGGIHQSRAVVVAPEFAARPVLIMGLSRLLAPALKTVEADIENACKGEFGAREVALPVRDFNIFADERRTSGRPVPSTPFWQQNIRAMWYHWRPGDRSLKLVLVLPSEESKDQFCFFRQYCDALFNGKGRDVEIQLITGPGKVDEPFAIVREGQPCRDYEEYDYVRQGLEQGMKLAGMRGFAGSDVCIDVTPGQKTFSIAGAIITLNSEAIYSYVTTQQPDTNRGGDVKVLDAEIETELFPAT